MARRLGIGSPAAEVGTSNLGGRGRSRGADPTGAAGRSGVSPRTRPAATGRPIRVLLTVPRLASTSGPYREVMAIAKYLPRGEFDLTVCSLRRRGYRDTSPLLWEMGIPWFVSEYRPTGHSWGYLAHLPASLRAQREIDRRGPFDIQHPLDFSSLPFEAFLARAKSRIYVFNQGTMNEYGNRVMLRLKIRLADRIIAISDSVVELLRKLGASAEKLRRIYLGIDLEELPPGLTEPARDAPRSLLSVGQLIPRKRHEDAIRAFAAVSPVLPDLRLRIAGGVDSDYSRRLLGLVAELGLSGKVEFLGLRDDVLSLMRESALLIHCAESEAFGWVLVEAMAAGLPVIVSEVDGLARSSSTDGAESSSLRGTWLPTPRLCADSSPIGRLHAPTRRTRGAAWSGSSRRARWWNVWRTSTGNSWQPRWPPGRSRLRKGM